MAKMFSKRDKKEEEDSGSNPFFNLESSTVLQEARVFNETPVNPKKCRLLLTRIIYLLNQGERVGRTEATQSFFAITKLFQCHDLLLRRLIYLAIKEMAEIADDVIIVTSSLTKDMTGKEDSFRASALRALCRITDPVMIQGIERYLKQAIVDKNVSVASSALVSSVQLQRSNPELVKRWVNEVQEAVSSDNSMVQYHALGLLYAIRKLDKLAVTKLVAKFTKQSPIRSPFAQCLLIRIVAKLIEEATRDAPEGSGVPDSESGLAAYLEAGLRSKHELVVLEAANVIVNLRASSIKQLTLAVSVLQVFLSYPKAVHRFAAVRALNKVAMRQPTVVAACNSDLETLVTDSNRSVATLAITTLLKTGQESSVDRLMKQIGSFMSEISDEFKVFVVEAVSALCIKFPRKHGVMLTFLSSMLRSDGGFEYKRAIVDAMVRILVENSEARETVLGHLCEFIEDCEHASLTTRVLHLLGQEGPKTIQPSKYIRYIYNRIMLDTSNVRASAVCTIAKFGAACDDLLASVLVLLRRSMIDTDDEVRDRATLFYHLLSLKQRAVNNAFVLDGLATNVGALEKALFVYSSEPSAEVLSRPFDLKAVPIDVEQQVSTAKQPAVGGPSPAAKSDTASKSQQDVYAEQLAKIPQFAGLGHMFKSSPSVDLTEPETEYNVRCIKHVFQDYVVLQFNCTNTLNDQLLEDVTVQVVNADGFEVVRSVPCARLQCGIAGTTYTCVRMPEDAISAASTTFACTLRFTVKDCDPQTGQADSEDDGYEDKYQLEELELGVPDHVLRLQKQNFAAVWDELNNSTQLEDTYALTQIKTIEEAVNSVIALLGLAVCDRTDKVPEGKQTHALLLSGVFRGGHDVLVRARFAVLDANRGVSMQITVRSSDETAAGVIASAVS